jgi:ATP-dependent HslUV protease ATP-binding subunit HslU
VRILTEPRASLVEQYIALLETEGVKLEFTKTGIRRIAEIAYEVNKSTENIGARRLYTILERLLENISFNATNLKKKQVIDAKYIDSQLSTLLENEDLSHYIL